MLGLWIDSLNDSERDRIIEHPDPTFMGARWWDADKACGCLVGCVLQPEYGGANPLLVMPSDTEEEDDLANFWDDVGCRFLALTKRFGAPRMWALVKARAAKRNRVNVEGGALATVGAP